MHACPMELHGHPESFGVVRLEAARIEAVPAGSRVSQWIVVPGMKVGDFVALSPVLSEGSQAAGLLLGAPSVFEDGWVYVALHNPTATSTPVMNVTTLVFWMRAPAVVGVGA